MKQKIVIRVEARCNRCRAKAMAIASKQGVESVTLEGTLRDEIVLIGEDVDVPCLTKRLRNKVGHASIVTVEDKEKLKKEADEKKKKEEDELKKFKDKEEKDKKEAEFTAEREKNELECYRRMQNPHYITQHNKNCNSSHHFPCKQFHREYHSYYPSPQYPCPPPPTMCVVDRNLYNDNQCIIM